MIRLRAAVAFVGATIGLLAPVGCAQPHGTAITPTIVVTSPAFKNGAVIPLQYTGFSKSGGPGISPPLRWKGAPKEARSIAVVVTDPDAPNGEFVHWVIYNIPPDAAGLPEHVSATQSAIPSAKQTKNDAGENGYYGPKPPPGGPHHYRFDVFALDRVLEVGAWTRHADAIRPQILDHTIAWGRLVGIYEKK
jgi:hypothetical protein